MVVLQPLKSQIQKPLLSLAHPSLAPSLVSASAGAVATALLDRSPTRPDQTSRPRLSPCCCYSCSSARLSCRAAVSSLFRSRPLRCLLSMLLLLVLLLRLPIPTLLFARRLLFLLFLAVISVLLVPVLVILLGFLPAFSSIFNRKNSI